MADMTSSLANLSIEEKEDEELAIEVDQQSPSINFLNCFVGIFLTSSIIHFESMRNTLANVWRPLGGITISDLGDRRLLFRLFHVADVDRIDSGSPWFFNGHMLILHRLLPDEDPMFIPLKFLNLWVMVHDLPIGFMSLNVAKQLGNFIGKFMEYEANLNPFNYQRIMRLRVQIDSTLPLKRKKKLVLKDGSQVYAKFQYEKIRTFCFLCGKLGHAENLCPSRLILAPDKIVFNWDISLRAPPRRAVPNSIWLRDEPEEINNSLGNTSGNSHESSPINSPFQKLMMAHFGGKNYGRGYQLPKLVVNGNNDSAKSKAPERHITIPMMDIQIGLENEDSPIEQSDGNKRQRKVNLQSSVSPSHDSDIELKDSAVSPSPNVSAGLSDQARRGK
ncbi:hypothetical protein HRI_003777900 [Hibiscus trionum]|uniref:CCHC-type domain-containing protein n=1 Tax=Hibiscus trionum TaxID=183268 RepID=A0A9W7IRV3_HIBTR|nr:hypothetical protein HRI_003777900 [Hibiscus trionum]